MTHTLTIALGDDADLRWAQATVTAAHYLHAPVDPRARPMAYIVRDASQPAPAAPNGVRIGLVMLGIPHATRCGGWWGYPGTPTQWQTVDLAGPRSYQTKNITSPIRKGTMLDTLDKNEVAPNTPTGAPTAMTIGAELRRLVEADPASHSSTTIRRIGQLDVQLVRWENKWTLYLADLVPIPHCTRDLWATAVSAPSVEWSQTPDGCSVWCEWTVSGPVRG